jgi:hypothetical protein
MLQLFVDGYYVGTPNDFGGEVELVAGPHRVELSAPGFESLAFDVKITSGQSINYKGALKPLNTPPAPAVAPLATERTGDAPKTLSATSEATFYYIPGCYMGNVPPDTLDLPANCDLSRLITRKP